MTTQTNAPKIFISYSWRPIQNKQKVTKLAERLTSDGIHVILDDWDLKEGHDKYSFMEQMVNNPDVKRVLLICNKEYANKANGKTGGVGIESLIISEDIYSKVEQTKFIPIVFEYDSEHNPCLPTFVKSRIFIDLSNEDNFENNYEILLRNIYNKPSSKRPPLGNAPLYIESDDPVFLPTAHKVSTIKNSLLSEKKNTRLLIQDYFDTFLNAINTFEIQDNEIDTNNFSDIVFSRVETLLVLKNDFIDFINTYISYSVEIDSELLHGFFEKALEEYINKDYNTNPSHTLGYLKGDSTRFFYHEMFLDFTAILLEKEKFSELAKILHTPLTIENKNRNEVLQYTFVEFRLYARSLNEFRNTKYQLNRVSIFADLVKQRSSKIKFDNIIEADILLYYISLLSSFKNSRTWFPETSCYNDYKSSFLIKTKSQRYFDKVKILFGVENKTELIEKINILVKTRKPYITDGNYNVPYIADGLNIESMCSLV